MGKSSRLADRRAHERKQLDQGKISQRLIEFAQPMIDRIVEETGTEPAEEELHNLLEVAITVWNAQVMEQVGRGSAYADQTRQLLSSLQAPPEVRDIMNVMLERKASEFPDDLRYIGNFAVFRAPDGELRVRAEARLESALRDEH